MPAVGEQLTAKFYVDQAMYKSVKIASLLRLDPKEKIGLG